MSEQGTGEQDVLRSVPEPGARHPNSARGRWENTMAKIVQFIHPGREFPVGETNATIRDVGRFDVDWSREPSHYRRLVKHAGSYRNSSGLLQQGELAFWTEWEGPTVAMRIGGARGRISARFIHNVCYPIVPEDVGVERERCCAACGDDVCGDGLLNTDPCVFGNTFKYSNCQQAENGVLRHLEIGSLILFMSRIDGQYYLDTAFIVGQEGVPYSTNKAHLLDCSQEYRALTLDRLSANRNFTFYRGAVVAGSDDANPLFSFVPAREWTGNVDACGRCRLDIGSLNESVHADVFSHGLTQKFKSYDADMNAIQNVWQEVVAQVTSQGFVLGVHFDWPTK